ncbi:MAG TPA: CDP-alcohol phosphatidyltransferase family protein [Thermoleophilia bacterium]
MTNLKTRYTDGARRGFFKIGVVLARLGLTADLLTIFGLVLAVGVVPLILSAHFAWAVLLGAIASICDAVDGAVARAGVGPTKAGAFLDSTTDRISELLVSGALVVYFARLEQWWPMAGVLVFMGAAQMVSYTRARAEALGVDCKVGLMSRPERLVVLGVGFLLSGWHIGSTSVLVWFVYLLALLTSLTVVHRMIHVMSKLRATA